MSSIVPGAGVLTGGGVGVLPLGGTVKPPPKPPPLPQVLVPASDQVRAAY
jgi:hypothetical protein